MAEKREKAPRFTTPKGSASFVWLKQPDTKFKPLGEYSISVVMGPDESATMIALLQPLMDEAFTKECAAFEARMAEAKGPVKAKMKAKGPINEGTFCTPEYDDDGEETGNTIFRFKMNASYLKGKGTPKEETIKMSPQLFDAKGTPLKTVPNIGSGSIVKVNFSPASYYTDAGHMAGISLKLNAVQIIDLVTFGGGGNAGSYGFDKEDGFEANPENEDGFRDESDDSDKGPADF